MTQPDAPPLDPTGDPADMAAAEAYRAAWAPPEAHVPATEVAAADTWYTVPNRAAKRRFRRALRAMRRQAARNYDKRFRPSGLPFKPAPGGEVDAHVTPPKLTRIDEHHTLVEPGHADA